MARPSAASSRIEPSEAPAKARPSHSPQDRRSSIARRLFCASRRISSSGSAAASRRSAWLPEEPSMRIAARRSALSSLFSCIPAAVRSRSALISGSVSFCFAFRIKERKAGSAPPTRAFAATSRSLLSSERSLNTDRASAMRPRTRLLTTISTFLPSISISPSAACCSTPAAFGSPSATSAAIAAIFSSLSSEVSRSTAPRSNAYTEKDKKRAAKAAPVLPERTC